MSHAIGFSGEQNHGVQIAYNSGPVGLGRTPDTRPPPDPKTFWNVPFRRNPDFVDHGNILLSIEKALALPAARFALTGLGGIGKSQLAIEFVYRHHKSLSDSGLPPFCFWVDAGSQSRFERSFMDIAVLLGLTQRTESTERQQDILQAMKDWLVDKRNGDWILVVDNADDLSVLFAETDSTGHTKRNLADFLPQSRHGKVLITSRSKTLALRLVGRLADLLEVQSMPDAQALELMRKKLSVDHSDEASAFALLKALDSVPLAIVQASAYINRRRPFTSIHKFLQDLRRNGPPARHLLEPETGDLDLADSRSILSALKFSWDFIGNRRRTAVWLLSLIAFFNCQGVQTSLLRRHRCQYAYDCKARHYNRCRNPITGRSYDSNLSHGPQSSINGIMRGSFAASSISATNSKSAIIEEILHIHCKNPTSNNEDGFTDDLHYLQDFSLVSCSEDGSVLQMHSLVRAAIRAWLRETDEHEKWEYLSFQILAEEFELETEIESLDHLQHLNTHVELDADPPPYGNSFKYWAQIIVAVGSYASDQNDRCLERKASEKMLHFVEKYGRKTFHKDVAFQAIGTLAFQLAQTGNCAAAEKLLHNLKDDRKAISAHDPDACRDLNFRAYVSYKSGKIDEAEALLRKAVKNWSSIDGENGSQTLNAMFNLGCLLIDKERYEEARSILSSLEGKFKRRQGERSSKTLKTRFHLAHALYQLAEFETSASLFQGVLDLCGEVLGENCTLAVQTAINLGAVRLSQGKCDEAEKLFRQTLEQFEDTFGKEYPDMETCRHNLEAALRSQRNRRTLQS